MSELNATAQRIRQVAQRALNRDVESAVASADLAGADIRVRGAEDYPPKPTNGIYVGGAGDVKVQLAFDRAPTTFVGLAAGFHPISCVIIFVAGTTATSVKALW